MRMYACEDIYFVDVSSTNATQFIKECIITSQFDHPNVLSLIGVCINVEDGIIHMVMPFMVHGDIRSYLRAKRGSVIEFDSFPEVRIITNVLISNTHDA